MRRIDLRSDTVTLPTPAMREAMYRAELGDDVFGEDPTVQRLEEMAAEKVGKEAALFVPSGTMGNLVSVLTHCGRGQGAIMGDRSHTFTSEVGGAAALGGVYILSIPNQADGTLRLEDIERAIPSEDIHHARARLLCIENTHNFCGGTVLTPQYISAVTELAHRYGLSVHLDGARIFNAAAALKTDVRNLTADVDSLMFCISKGLCAPVGSLICSTREYVTAARQTRKMVGGGLRQVGVIAAAGIVALEQMVGRLTDDHDNARLLANGLSEIPGLQLDPTRVQTNIVFFECHDPRWSAERLADALAKEGVLVLALGPKVLRAVTHYGIERTDIEVSLRIVRQVMQ